MTNDGVLSNKILEADNLHEKEYIVTVDKIINDDFINKMANGVDIGDVITRKCKVNKINDNTFNIVTDAIYNSSFLCIFKLIKSRI